MLIQRFKENKVGDFELNRYNHPRFANGVCEEYPTNEGDVAVVLEYHSYECVYVTFKDENTPKDFRLKCQLGELRKGRVKNPFKRQSHGVGYKGFGIYLTAKNGKNTNVWMMWDNMLSRCYNPKDSSYANYGGRCVTVCKYWHSFQNYACWVYQNKRENFELDKDLLSPQAKMYSEETCCFLPRDINSFVKTNLDAGVWFNGKKYVAQINHKGRNKIIGRYLDRQSALVAFIEEKCEVAKKLAESFKNEISNEAYSKLLNYKDRYEKLNQDF